MKLNDALMKALGNDPKKVMEVVSIFDRHVNKRADEEAQDLTRMGVILGKCLVDWLRANVGSIELSLRALARAHIRASDPDLFMPGLSDAGTKVEEATANLSLALECVMEPIVKELGMEDIFGARPEADGESQG